MDRARVALVTGGAEGIGACTVQKLAESGYYVFFCDISDDRGTARQKYFADSGLHTEFVTCDISDPDAVRGMAGMIRKKSGSLDLIVNNAGIADPAMKFPSDNTDSWRSVIDTNLSGSFYTANFLSDLMPEGSAIVMMSSTRALQSEPDTLAYSASKGGILALTHSLAVTLSSRRIRVNAILPGWIDTSAWKLPPVKSSLDRLDHEQHPSGRAGRPEDVANLVLFLASGQGEWINGQSIVLDGGMTRRMIYLDREVIENAEKIRETGS